MTVSDISDIKDTLNFEVLSESQTSSSCSEDFENDKVAFQVVESNCCSNSNVENNVNSKEMTSSASSSSPLTIPPAIVATNENDNNTKVDNNNNNNNNKRDRYEGWLKKEGGRIKTTKKRYFVLRSNTLYYKKDKESNPIGLVQLIDIDIRVTGETEFCLTPGKDKAFKIKKDNSLKPSNHIDKS
ncbi:hypothetical protein PPL_06028 [Heterostelium album PN500]|uniref:PH domain-containing protein n=1 Tax=Heterostelium pallidum (strain ATCC 26659 / Pp 5 / PN500) TaxID=670386 RepID=D3BC08_HETP5|nr:hypothetical protein PPL_06028 [Heterostelium album PN500]EFA81191.1 hypothetical protein PPL_06028 [Heterostelium album PN500]|eukprot:XP_020433309.1 hypothetical protein PPL_06028 [Heterostelium album PN500]